ncbi:MAG: cyclase family protein [Gemmatimonadota bacterium]
MIYDISPPIRPSLAVFPGDTPPSREVLLDMSRGDPITLSTLRSTAHVGAHLDAPSHYGRDADPIDLRRLELFVGPAEVVRVDVPRGELVTPEAMPEELRAPRVLIATRTVPDRTVFNRDFAALAPHLIEWLDRRGVFLVGVDTPSVDPADSRELASHRAVLERDMNILEGIDLDDVPEGVYELIALPLRLVGFDASPVRAVLRPLVG